MCLCFQSLWKGIIVNRLFLEIYNTNYNADVDTFNLFLIQQWIRNQEVIIPNAKYCFQLTTNTQQNLSVTHQKKT